MAAFLTDNFTGTNGTLLTAHTPDTGSAWATGTGGNNLLQIQGNRIQQPANLGTHGSGRNTTSPPSADYYVEGVFVLARANNTVYGGVTGRHSSSADTFYWGAYDKNNNRWDLLKRVAGVNTSLGTWSETLSAGNSRTVKLEMIGSAIKLYVNTTQRISVTDSAITATGFAGLCLTGGAIVASDGEIDSITANSTAVAWTQTNNDTISITDAISRAWVAKVNNADTISVSDAVAKAVAHTNTDTASITDGISNKPGKFNADTMEITDAISKLAGKVNNDTMSITDALSHIWEANLSLADSASITDALNREWEANLTFADTMEVTDALSKLPGKVLADTLLIMDAQARALAHGGDGSVVIKKPIYIFDD